MLTIKDIEFSIDIEPEYDVTPEEDLDPRAARWVRKQLDSGNDWAWCVVKVTASYKGFEGTDYLGASSYKSEKDFKRGGYYEDMQQRALESLISDTRYTAEQLEGINIAELEALVA